MYIGSGRAEFVREYATTWGFSDSSAGKEHFCNAGDLSLIPGMGGSPREGIGYPLEYSWFPLNSHSHSMCKMHSLWLNVSQSLNLFQH